MHTIRHVTKRKRASDVFSQALRELAIHGDYLPPLRPPPGGNKVQGKKIRSITHFATFSHTLLFKGVLAKNFEYKVFSCAPPFPLRLL